MSLKTSIKNDFPSISREKWEEKIQIDLKGKDYDRALVWKSNENVRVKPYYRSDDNKGLEYLTESKPNCFPFVNSAKADNDWNICQEIHVYDAKEANTHAVDILNKGVTALTFVLDSKILKTDEEWSQLLNGIVLDAIQINFKNFHSSRYKFFIAYLESTSVDLSKVNGSYVIDPIGELISTGVYEEKHIKDIVTLISEFKTITPKVKFINITGSHFNNAGASSVEELAYSMSMAVEYINLLTEEGLDAEDIIKSIVIEFGIGANYFMEISKFRAARVLFANIAKSYKVSEKAQRLIISAITGDWNKTIYDPHVNILRSTTEAMSATIAGVDTLVVKPFDSTYKKPGVLSERIARNIQSILKEESNFNKVIDPSAGSYYIENLTDAVISEAWKLFLEVEEKGGFISAFKSGFIQDKVSGTANKRVKDIATRKENLLGTNQFPKLDEQILTEIDEKIAFKNLRSETNLTAEPLKIFRGTNDFEKLRLKTEMAAKTPTAFMLTYGNLAMRLARSQFSGNFMAVAGFNIIDNAGFDTIEEGIEAAKKSGAEVIVICSSDDAYAEIAPKVYDGLDKAITVIAGNPRDCMEDLKAKGIKYFIGVRSNVYETLTGIQKDLNI